MENKKKNLYHSSTFGFSEANKKGRAGTGKSSLHLLLLLLIAQVPPSLSHFIFPPSSITVAAKAREG